MHTIDDATNCELRVFDDASDFLSRCGPALAERETQDGLMWAIALRLQKNPSYYGSRPFLACVESSGQLQLMALMTPPTKAFFSHKLQLSLLQPCAQSAVSFFANALYQRGVSIPGVMGETATVQTFSSRWCSLSGQQSQQEAHLQIYALHTVQTKTLADGSCRPATITDLDMAVCWAEAFHRDCFGERQIPEEQNRRIRELIEQGDLYLWVSSAPVSMAAFTRSTPNSRSISFVYTPDQFRNKGYASSLVSSISQIGLDRGNRFCTLFADLSNPTSNAIYQRIGYAPVADVIETTFSLLID